MRSRDTMVRGLGLNLGWDHRIVLSTLAVRFSTHVGKWVQAKLMLGVYPMMD